jgi:hypothetical protein
MRIDNLQQFVRLRSDLAKEKTSLERRLHEINEALGEIPPPRASSPVPGALGRPRAGGTSLKTLILEALAVGPKTKEELLSAVQQRGYRFSTNNPMNSLGVILYGKNPRFERTDGRFSLSGVGQASVKRTGKSQMSAAGRARIVAAQRKRWAGSRKQSGINSSKNRLPQSLKRRVTPVWRKKLAEAARKRWAAAKAAGKSRL